MCTVHSLTHFKSGEEEEDSEEESESGEDSGDTASEQSGATPEHNDGSDDANENEGSIHLLLSLKLLGTLFSQGNQAQEKS